MSGLAVGFAYPEPIGIPISAGTTATLFESGAVAAAVNAKASEIAAAIGFGLTADMIGGAYVAARTMTFWGFHFTLGFTAGYIIGYDARQIWDLIES